MQDDTTDKKAIVKVITTIISESERLKRDKTEFPTLSYLNLPTCIQIIQTAKSILEQEPAVLQINTSSELIIVGDLHGSLESLVRIFKDKGYPPRRKYLFLGDFVDRGKCSCEVMLMLYSLKCLFPKDVYLIRGNHEFSEMTDFYGFKSECENRIENISTDFSITTPVLFYDSMIDSFSMLPICAIINDSIFCVHGGISHSIKCRKDLLKIKKVGKEFTLDELPQEEMLWNDPDKSISTYKFSSRGRGMIFGDEAVKIFLRSLNFKLIIRGHQDARKGYDWPFGVDGGILTVFSVIDYLRLRNNGGIAIIPVFENCG